MPPLKNLTSRPFQERQKFQLGMVGLAKMLSCLVGGDDIDDDAADDDIDDDAVDDDIDDDAAKIQYTICLTFIRHLLNTC